MTRISSLISILWYKFRRKVAQAINKNFPQNKNKQSNEDRSLNDSCLATSPPIPEVFATTRETRIASTATGWVNVNPITMQRCYEFYKLDHSIRLATHQSCLPPRAACIYYVRGRFCGPLMRLFVPELISGGGRGAESRK